MYLQSPCLNRTGSKTFDDDEGLEVYIQMWWDVAALFG